jgi:hypothetical protein
MIQDEVKAFPEYSELIREGMDAEVARSDLEKIGKNRFDEKRHGVVLKNIHKKYCGGK